MKNVAARSPTIIVNVSPEVGDEDIAQLFYGMEEEGIPFQRADGSGATLIARAYEAANQSPLSVGVAVSREEIVVHYKNLPADSPLFVLRDYARREKERVRALGSNAARLVKGLPFKRAD